MIENDNETFKMNLNKFGYKYGLKKINITDLNTSKNYYSTIAGGYSSTASGTYNFIGSGKFNSTNASLFTTT
jgi:hypothetical protein